jgi:hypothetical protein
LPAPGPAGKGVNVLTITREGGRLVAVTVQVQATVEVFAWKGYTDEELAEAVRLALGDTRAVREALCETCRRAGLEVYPSREELEDAHGPAGR